MEGTQITKDYFFYGLLISTALLFALAIPSENVLLTLTALLFLCSNVLLIPRFVHSQLIQSGYRIIPPPLILLLLCVYGLALYRFTKAWIENLQYILWELIVDNLTNILAAGFLIFFTLLLIGFYLVDKSRLGRVRSTRGPGNVL